MMNEFYFRGAISGFLHTQMVDQSGAPLEPRAFDLGFLQFAMGHHDDLAGPPKMPEQEALIEQFYAGTWPAGLHLSNGI
jgi:hypothetical protein